MAISYTFWTVFLKSSNGFQWLNIVRYLFSREKTDNRISKDIMRTQILQASLSHIQAIGLNTRDRKLQLLNIHIFI